MSAGRPNFGERWQSLPLAGGSTAALLILLGLGLMFVNERSYQAQRVREASIQAEILAASTMAAVDFGDRRAAQETVAALGANPQVQFAAVFDETGKVFAEFGRSGAVRPATAAAARASRADAVIGVAPIGRPEDRIGSVAIGTARESLVRKVTRYALIGLFILLAAVIAAILGSAQAALRRSNRVLQARAQELAESNRKLGDEMEERARAEEQLRQAQKIQALGQLTGGIAHDFNNLLTVIQGSADLLKRPGLSDERRARYIGAISETAGRAASLTSQLLSFARRQPLRPQQLDLNEHIRGMAELLDRALGERITVTLALAPDACDVSVDPTQLENAVLNIAVNARDAMPDGGVLTIRSAPSASPLDSGPAVDLEIADTGSGMDAETLARVFEPFFTTKEVGKGTGLGLSQVYGFAAQSGGRVSIDSRPGEGSTIRLSLPCAASAKAVPGIAEPSASVASLPSCRILVVDDNEGVGALAEGLLMELGHQVVRARSGDEALMLLAGQPIDMVFSDIVMPGMSGIDLAKRVAARYPAIPIILTTGFSDELSVHGAKHLPVLLKPYNLDRVARVLSDVLSGGSESRGGLTC